MYACGYVKKFHYPYFIKLKFRNKCYNFQMHSAIFGGDPVIFLINRVKYTTSSHIELLSHCYYESHLVLMYYFLKYYTIQFVSILSSFCFNFQVYQVLTAMLC